MSVLVAFATVVLIGGGNFVAVRFSNRELAPFWGAGARFALAAALLFAVTYALRLPVPRGRAATGALLYGVLGFGGSYAFLYWGLLAAPAALASVIVALLPLETLAIAAAVGLERLRVRGVAGGAIALLGTIVVFADRLGADVPIGSLLACFAGSLCIAASTVAAKGFPRGHPIPTNALGMIPGAALLLALSLATGEVRAIPSQPEVIAAFAYLVLIGSTALFVAYLYVLQRWTASAAAYTTVLFPVVTTALGALLAREMVTGSFLLGAAIVMAGVYIGALAPERRPAPGPAAA